MSKPRIIEFNGEFALDKDCHTVKLNVPKGQYVFIEDYNRLKEALETISSYEEEARTGRSRLLIELCEIATDAISDD